MLGIANSMYLNSSFLDWYADTEGGSYCEADALHRAYDIWRHARDRTSATASDHDRIDAISALRRSVNHRLKSLRTTYNFDYLPSVLGKKQVLERLQEFGIVRSAIIKDLLEVRNLIEHEDIDPPDLEKCRRFVDITWYFLKSTDKLLDVKNDYLRFLAEDERINVGVSVHHTDNWRLDIRAEVPAGFLHQSQTPNTIAIDTVIQKEIRGKKGFFLITATAALAGDQLLSFARSYFAANGYWHDDSDA